MLKRPLVLFFISVVVGVALLYLGYLAGLSHTAPALGRTRTVLSLFGIVLLGYIGSVSGFMAFWLIAKRSADAGVKALAILACIGYGFWIAGNTLVLLIGLIFNSNPHY